MKAFVAILLGFSILTGARADPLCDLAAMNARTIVEAFQGGLPLPELRKILTNPALNKHTSKDEQEWQQMFAEKIYVQDPAVLKVDRVAKMQLAICNRLGYDEYITLDQRGSYRPARQVEWSAPIINRSRPTSTNCISSRDGAGGGYLNCTTY